MPKKTDSVILVFTNNNIIKTKIIIKISLVRLSIASI